MQSGVRHKMLAAMLVFLLLWCPWPSGASAETTVYAGASTYQYTSQPHCPDVSLDALFPDDIQAETANALQLWFLSEYAYRMDWYDILWNHSEVVLLEPYIIKTEYTDDCELTVYCSSAISTYALLEDTTGEQYFAQGTDTAGLFRICFGELDPNSLYISSVHCISDYDEELYPGAGAGTDGFPGLSDQLAQEIPEWGLDTSHIAEKYLEINHIPAKIVAW